MKHLIIVCLFMLTICYSITSYSQKVPIKWGDIPIEDLKMTTYPEDTTASAVILCDYGVVVENELRRHIRIKIINKNAASNWATFKIPYFELHGLNTPKNIKAQTYNLLPDGKIEITKLESKEIFIEKLFDIFHRKNFAIPGIKDGSVFELKYTQNYKAYGSWYFQAEIPVRHSEYLFAESPYIGYSIEQKGFTCFDKYEEIEGANYTYKRFVMQNVPALKPEPYITNMNDYFASIKMYVHETPFSWYTQKKFKIQKWEDVAESLLFNEKFGRQLEWNNNIKRLAKQVVDETDDQIIKLKKIHTYIVENFKWANYDMLVPRKDGVNKTFKLKTGAGCEINFILILMLKKAGLKVYPAILSTRDNGKITEKHPSLDQFNHVIAVVYIGNKVYLVDATDPFCPYTLLPERIINGKAQIIKENWNYDWIELKNEEKNQKQTMAVLEISDENNLKGTINQSKTGYYALNDRKEIDNKGLQDYQNNKLSSSIQDIVIDEVTTDNVKDLYAPLKNSWKISSAMFMQKTDSLIIINPFLNLVINENPFKNNKRLFEVNFASGFDEKYILNLSIPDNYEVINMPEKFSFTIPGNGIKFSILCNSDGKSIQLISSFSLIQTIFPIEEPYENLMAFYQTVVTKHKEQIVLKKKI